MAKFSEGLARNARWICGSLLIGSWRHENLWQASVSLLAVWLCWRCWKFTISPWLHQDAPKELPYGIPVFGHGIAFFKNSPSVLMRARKHFGGKKDPYALTLFGTTIYVITDPKHVAEVHKNTESLTFEEFVIAILEQSGMSKAGIQTVYKPLPKDKPGFPNPNGDSMSTLVHSINVHQGYPGRNLVDLDGLFVKWFDHQFRFPSIVDTCAHYSMKTSSETCSIQVPLWQFCSEIQVQVAGDVYFGETLGQVEPDYVRTFLEFDDLCWQILYQYPSFMTTKLTTAMKKMQSALERYIRIPQSKRNSVFQIKTEEDELRRIGVSEHDMAILFFNIFWGINTNSRKTAFWIVNYLLHNPTQLELIRQETAPAFQGDKLIDLNHLYEHCPLLTDVWHETLRMYSHATSARAIKRDTVIGGKVLRKGHRIMIPYRILHFDAQVWGDEVNTFKPDRFAARTSELTKSSSWRPFGGGKSLCSGRYVARHLAFMFVAMLLRRFDVEKLGNPIFPEGDIGKPVLGMMSIKEEEDYLVEIKKRKADA